MSVHIKHLPKYRQTFGRPWHVWHVEQVNGSTVGVVNATSMSSGHEELTSHTDWLEELVALGALSSEMNESSSDMGVPLHPGLLAPSLDVQVWVQVYRSQMIYIHTLTLLSE